jgi:glycosyltransferase involved in cell wall biosynthesis
VLVVPSLVAETFGLVIMEGLASGCGVIASDVGALKDTVGPCGFTFPPGDAASLASHLEAFLTQPGLIAKHQALADGHLQPYRRQNSLKAYLALIEHAAQKIAENAPADVSFTPNTL